MSDKDITVTTEESSGSSALKKKRKLRMVKSKSTLDPAVLNPSLIHAHGTSPKTSKKRRSIKLPKGSTVNNSDSDLHSTTLPSLNSKSKQIRDDASTSSNTSSNTHPPRSSRSKHDESSLHEMQLIFEDTVRRLEQKVNDLQEQIVQLNVTVAASHRRTASDPPSEAAAKDAAVPVSSSPRNASLTVPAAEPLVQRSPVILNVGGVEYATTLSTLVKFPNSMLGILFSGKFAATTDSQGRFFLDRDGTIFRYILEFLRTNSIASVDINNEILVRQVAQEAEYFQLTPLLEMLSRRAKRVGSRQLMVVEGVDAQLPMYTRKEIHTMKLKHASTPNSKIPMNLAGIELPGIDLSRLDLSYTNFSRTNLKGASFENCILIGCLFSQCNLQDANFQQCRFSYSVEDAADFTDAFLRGANFTRYIGEMFKANLDGADLTDTNGLDLRWLR